MDGKHFDEFARTLARAHSRRQVLRGLVGAAGTLFGLRGPDRALAQTCRDAGRLCVQHANCCSGLCDAATKLCVCPTGTENCRGACKRPADYQADLANCGSCGNRCLVVANGVAVCTGGACDFICNPGYHRCGTECVTNNDPAHCGDRCEPCATPSDATATCTDGQCGFSCNAGFHGCDDDTCARNDDATRCGPSCTNCMAPANALSTCVEGACGFTCDSGYGPCGAGCCPNAQVCCNNVCCSAGQTCIDGQCQTPCLNLRDSCTTPDQCCQNQPTFCAELNDVGLCSLTGETCCRPLAGSCTHDCDCCDFRVGTTGCRDGRCCRSAALSPCSSNRDCCGDSVCFTGRCCRFTGQTCTISTECCSGVCCNGTCCNFGLVCDNGGCQVP